MLTKHKRKLGLVLLLMALIVVAAGCSVPRGSVDPEAPPEGVWQAVVVFPLTEALMFLNGLIDRVGIPYSYGWAIILFTIIVKLLTLPLTLSQMRSTRAMQALQPRMQEIQKKYAKDRETLAQKQMELYKEAGVNPMGGCLPMLIQFPVLIGLYHALYRLAAIGELGEQRFFWIPDLSFPGAEVGTSWLTQAWQAQDWGQLATYLALPLLLVVTQIVVQKMTQAASPTSDQQTGMMNNMFLVMSIMFGWITLGVPSGLALYWVVSNVLSLVQQYFMVNRFAPAPVAVSAQAEATANPAKAALPSLDTSELTSIKGIGPKTAAVLAAAGIETLTDLAASSEEALTDVVGKAGLPEGDYAYWIRQAGKLEDKRA